MEAKRITVPLGALVTFEDVGVQVSVGLTTACKLNKPERNPQPFVNISTEYMAEEYLYGERYRAVSNSDGTAVVIDSDRDEYVASFCPVPDHLAARRNATRFAEALNEAGARGGLPRIAVHLNDATIYDDEGAGPIHQSDTPKTDRLKRAEELLREISRAHDAVSDRQRALRDQIAEFLVRSNDGQPITPDEYANRDKHENTESL